MILIRNIYYMLSYAFQVLNEQGYKNMAVEHFNNVSELFAAILEKGLSLQLKRGLGREYIEQTESLSSLRGRIELSESIKTRSMYKKQLICTYDEFSVNSYMNQIIKATIELLFHADISKTRKRQLRKLLVFFGEVENLDVHTINWNLKYKRNNQTYRMLISICFLVVKGLMQTNSDGLMCLMDFLDEQRMSRLYEKFILEYYRKEFPQISTSASRIPWAVDDGMRAMLPVMQSDIMLSFEDKVLIIDAKYYSHTTQAQYDVNKVHSNNLYQIFTYIKNKDFELAEVPHVVSGLILYAKTMEAVQPNNTYLMSGNKISVKTLDLNCDFTDIAGQLNKIVEEHFGIAA